MSAPCGRGRRTGNGKGEMRGFFAALRMTTFIAVVGMLGCRGRAEAPGAVVMIIESSPNNLDLRQGTDAQSERVGALVFDALVKKDEHFNLVPWLATRWEQPDNLTWVVHLRDVVRFQDGRALGAEDVAYTIRSMIDGAVGGLITAKAGAFAAVDKVEVLDRLTVRVRLKRPDAGLLFNMSDGLFGVVPRGAGRDFGLHPVGSGAFRFVSAVQDKEVVLENITAALELKKGSADLASNVVTLDEIHTLEQEPNLKVESGPSSVVIYTNFNVNDAVLKDKDR